MAFLIYAEASISFFKKNKKIRGDIDPDLGVLYYTTSGSGSIAFVSKPIF